MKTRHSKTSTARRTRSVFGLLALFVSFIAAAADPLTERGIDPRILDSMVSDLSAEVGYTRFAEIRVVTDQGEIVDRAIFQFDPSTDYGIDFYAMFETEKPSTGHARHFRRSLENNMRLQHLIRTMDVQYDRESLEVESKDGSKAVILFRYSRFALPQEVAWMRHLQGRIWTDGDRVERIRLELDEGQTYFHERMRVREFETDANFVRLSNGRDVLRDSESTIVGTPFFGAGRETTITVSTTTISFSGSDGEDLTPGGIAAPSGVDPANFDNTVRVNLDRTWPIWGRGARKAGFEVPKPFGAGFLYTDLTTRMDFNSFEINGESQAIEAIFEPNGSGIDVDATSPMIRLDWFPLPFVNVMALVGKAEADGVLLIRTTDLAQLIGLPEVITETIDLTTDMVGVGVTLAAGYKNFFGNITAQVSNSRTEGAGTDSDIVTTTAMVGYFFPRYRMRVMLGAEYFDIENKMKGSIPLPDGNTLDFNIGVETEEWAGRVGVYKEIGSSFEASAMYTFGDDRDGFTLLFGYRF